jgi:excisionase family DNA binding protein
MEGDPMQKMITVAELSSWLGVPVQTIYNYNCNGTGPKRIRIGNHVRYRVADVEAWLRQHERAAA